MSATGFATFETAIGPCAIAWGRGGIVAVQLPGTSADATRRRITNRFPDAIEARPHPGIDLAIRDITALLAGGMTDLTRITLDMSVVPDFHRRVYTATRAILPGLTSTYGAIARTLGEPGAARAVGQALGQNPFAIVVPCHRVLASGGRTGGFSASGGVVTKLALLTIEQARIGDAPSLFDAHGGLPLAANGC